MDASFWHERWETGRTAFHEHDGNALLKRHIDTLALTKGDRLFVPLAGKTRDIGWLLHQGFSVVACELNAMAVSHLFEDLGVEPEIEVLGPVTRKSIPGLVVFVGDIFDVTPDQIGPVDAVFDRAAVVAMPDTMRQRYVDHVIALSAAAPQLVITFEYAPGVLKGPPFSVDAEQMSDLYAPTFRLKGLHHGPVPGGLRGTFEVQEAAWHLTALLQS